MFWPTFWDLAFLAGSIGLFYFMFLLFVRLMPVLSMFELRKLAQSAGRVEVGRVSTRRGAGLDPPGGAAS
jgi:hypothetical protein